MRQNLHLLRQYVKEYSLAHIRAVTPTGKWSSSLSAWNPPCYDLYLKSLVDAIQGLWVEQPRFKLNAEPSRAYLEVEF